jgi:hypothetical protein
MSGQPNQKIDGFGNPISESYVGDMKFRGEYSGSNLIYKGYAKPGADESDEVWQIAEITYSGSNITEINWPQNALGKASSNFEFSWTDRATYTYS